MNKRKSLLDRVGGKWATSLIPWVALSPVGIFGVFFGFGFENLANHGFELFLIVCLGYLASGAVPLVARKTFLRPGAPSKPKPLSALLVFVLTGLVAGLTTAGIVHQLGIVQDYDFPRAVVTRTWLGIYWSTLATLALASFDDFRTASRQLESQISQSLELSQNLEQSVIRIRKNIVDSIKRTLSEAMDKSDPKNLNRLADTVLRPMTSRLNQNAHFEALAMDRDDARLEVSKTIKSALISPKSLLLASAAGAFYSAPLTIYRLGLNGLLNLLVLALVIATAFQIMKKLPSQRLTIRFALIAAGLCFSCGLGVGIENFSESGMISLGLLNIGGWLVALLFIFLSETEHNLSLRLSELRKKAAKTNWLEQRFKQEVWVESKKLARIVHGTVQSKIRAAAISQRGLSDAELNSLLDECLELIDQGVEAVSFTDFISQSRKLWAGALEIEIDLADRALRQVEQDPIALAALIEVAREALLNAVRHGKATLANIQLSETSQSADEVYLRVTNDGFPPDPSRKPGLGSSVFDELTIEWFLDTDPSGVALRARIPVQKA